MLLPSLFTYMLFSFIGISVSVEGSRYDEKKTGLKNSQIVPGKFIVEFHPGNSDGHNVVESFLGELDKRGFYPQRGLNFSTHSVFEGCSFQVHEKTNPDDILALDMVKSIWPVRTISAPRPKVVAVGGSAGTPTWTSHARTGVLDLHKMGFLGEGVVIGVIDTGIDYTHPALRDKVLGGYDFVGDKWISGKKVHPDYNISDCNGHGSHVAGIIAGEPPEEQFISVAPKAKLRGYKIFGCDDDATDDLLIINALLKAYSDGVDIINVSIGEPGGWSEVAWQVVASNLVKQGVFITMAAGNDGQAGPWYAGSTGLSVLSVASIDNEELLVFPAIMEAGNVSKNTTYLDSSEAMDGWQLGAKLPVYATSMNISDPSDACTPLSGNTPDLSHKLVLVRRGECTFAEKAANVAAKGGRYLMFYNNVPSGLVLPDIGDTTIKYVGMITARDGAYLVNSFAAGENTAIFFPKKGGISTPNYSTGGYASSFTEWGPSWEGYMKPEIAAPGGSILSTYPVMKGGYAILSGTSMASPYIAGIAALYYGKHGGRKNLPTETAAELKKRIISSGRAIDWNNGNRTYFGQLAPTAQIGGGYVNATKVLTYQTSVSPGKLELNDTMFFNPHHTITIRNSGHQAVDYTITHLPVSTFYTFQDYRFPTPFPPAFVNDTASVIFSSESIIISPNTTASFNVTFTPPQRLDKASLPVYGGKIVITGSNGERLEVPYLGIWGNIKKQYPWGKTSPIINDSDGYLFTKPRNFNFTNGNMALNFTYTNYWGSREIRFDVVAHDWQEQDFRYPPVPGNGTKFVGSLVALDNTIFPSLWECRHDIMNQNYQNYQSYRLFSWGGLISTNGIRKDKLPPGKYKINMRALKVFGSPGLTKDWESYTSPVITTSWG